MQDFLCVISLVQDRAGAMWLMLSTSCDITLSYSMHSCASHCILVAFFSLVSSSKLLFNFIYPWSRLLLCGAVHQSSRKANLFLSLFPSLWPTAEKVIRKQVMNKGKFTITQTPYFAVSITFLLTITSQNFSPIPKFFPVPKLFPGSKTFSRYQNFFPVAKLFPGSKTFSRYQNFFPIPKLFPCSKTFSWDHNFFPLPQLFTGTKISGRAKYLWTAKTPVVIFGLLLYCPFFLQFLCNWRALHPPSYGR